MGQAIKRNALMLAGQPTLFRHGLANMLRDWQPTWHLIEVNALAALVEELRDERPEILLLDNRLFDMDGTNGLRRLHSHFPLQKILILAESDDRASIIDCIGAGARGYLTKWADPSQVVCALQTVLAGGVFAPASLTRTPTTPHIDTSQPLTTRLATFTDRQRDVYELMAHGYATKTIARRLDLSVGTVKVHLAAIYRAVGAHNRTEAIARLRAGTPLAIFPAQSAGPVQASAIGRLSEIRDGAPQQSSSRYRNTNSRKN